MEALILTSKCIYYLCVLSKILNFTLIYKIKSIFLGNQFMTIKGFKITIETMNYFSP